MSIDKTYKLYVFDLDGTLVDTKLDIARALQKIMRDAGYPEPELSDVVKTIGGGARNSVFKVSGLEGDALKPLLAAFAAAYEQMCTDNSPVYEGGEALLRRLKEQGARLAMITMKSKAPTLKILKTRGVLNLFDAVVTFDDTERRKPEPDSLFELQRKFAVVPGDTLMIGDSITDMKFAQAAGVDIAVVEYGYGDTHELAAKGPRYMLGSLLDF